MMGKCCACDRKLTAAEAAIEFDFCPSCRAEHDTAYLRNRVRLLAALLVALRRMGR